MGTFEFLMLIVIVISVLLVLIILSQNPKGGGLSSSFGGGGGQMFGVDRTNKFLDNATWTLASVIAALVIIASVLKENPKSNLEEVEAKPAATEQTEPITPSNPNPSGAGQGSAESN